VVVWLVVFSWIAQLRGAEQVAARREISAFATLLADHTDRTLQGVDLLLTILVGKLEAVIARGDADPAMLHAILRSGLEGMPQIRSGLVLAPDGTSIGDADAAVPRRFNGSDRVYFQVHRGGDDSGLFIGDPVQSRINGLWAISLSRRLKARDGAFAGIIVAAVDPSYFAALYSSTGASADLDATLLKRSGVVLATTAGEPAQRLGRTVQEESGDFAVLARQPEGVVRVRTASGRDDRLAAFASAKAYPLMVLVARSADLIARQTVSGERMIAAAGVAMTLLVMMLGAVVLRQVRSLESRFRDGIERMSDGFLLWDRDERLIAWNSRCERLIPETAGMLRPGLPFAEFARHEVVRGGGEPVADADVDAGVARRIARFRAPGEAWESTRYAGRVLEIEESRTASGGVVSICRDTTQRKRHAEALERALVTEREANLVHRRFIAMASHEFRTPLAVIDGAAQRVMDLIERNPAKIAERMTRIRDAVARMTRLMDRMLSSARLDEGRIEVHLERVDLSVLLSEAVGRQRQISPGFEIALALPAGPIVVDGDPELLEHVFSNLLSNAVKYSGRARQVEVAALPGARAEGGVDVTVSDRGVGIPPDEIGLLFARFFRARTASGIPGTGIGLHLVRELVHMHGGTIDVSSTLGAGTTFVVRMPPPRERSAPSPA
jgi:signal transduction histidine kinase